MSGPATATTMATLYKTLSLSWSQSCSMAGEKKKSCSKPSIVWSWADCFCCYQSLLLLLLLFCVLLKRMHFFIIFFIYLIVIVVVPVLLLLLLAADTTDTDAMWSMGMKHRALSGFLSVCLHIV